MPILTLKCPYGQNEEVISPEELLETYFFGVPICDADGKTMSSEVIKFYIDAATEDLEDELDIKIIPQVIEEDKDFWFDDYKMWGYIRVTYPITKGGSLNGFINDVIQIEYPPEWLSVRKTSDGKLYHRNLYLVPTNGAATSNSVVFSGITPHLGFFGNTQIPNYWKVRYCTGFDKAPKDLIDIIGKLAAINLFAILGDLILGAGIAAQSIGLDGLSQSISSTASATSSGFGARIILYDKYLKRQMPSVRSYYKGITMASL